ncbi:hypothetical protein [Natrinema hispanicum]|uniref:Uncharacterized protein n=1 Tax=Natrinema hispanicum TaxID=392421 RepID=A0A1I0GDE6_9EURY|nr:hypothetical protein [Natrinema hispanicum]SDC57138.1 hypothetical protein SAMN05192552_100550 [Natrinema hispanicum]SET68245.1 hypothetical protein SAMN04488694_11070 [Natrinema hispanicum]
MKDISRRKLLAATGASTGLVVAGAGCLGDPTSSAGNNGEPDDTTSETDEGAAELTPLERWVPATGSAELLFHYRDLTTVRQLEDTLQPAVTEAVSTLPDGESATFVEQFADGESAVDSVCRFGSKGVAGNVVVAGSFDPDAADAALEPAAGDFGTFERDGVSVAVSSETLIVSPSDGAALEAILAAGVEGADRRIDSDVNFAPLLDHIGLSTFVWGEHERQNEANADGYGAAYAWSLGPETTTQSMVAVSADSQRMDEFEDTMADRFDDVTVETDGTVGVATRTIPTADYEYRDLFAERGSEPPQLQAGVTIDADSVARTVTVTFTAKSDGVDRLEIRDQNGLRDELTEVGQATTLEYESGASGTITAVAVGDETERVVATESFSF